MSGRTEAVSMPLALDAEELLDFVAHDIWAHTAHDDDCSKCGAYEPCAVCMKVIYRPAADAVLETVRRADVRLGSGTPGGAA